MFDDINKLRINKLDANHNISVLYFCTVMIYCLTLHTDSNVNHTLLLMHKLVYHGKTLQLLYVSCLIFFNFH